MPNSTLLILAAVIVLAVVLGGVLAFLYVRARRTETEEKSADSETQQDALRQKEEQVTRIRQRIEELYQQQQQEQRVQHAQLSQQMDDVKLHVETNDRKVDGLRNELHHEIERRNEELEDLRYQLAGALDAFWKTHDALPEGQQDGPRMLTAGPGAEEEAPPEVESAPQAPMSAPPTPTAADLPEAAPPVVEPFMAESPIEEIPVEEIPVEEIPVEEIPVEDPFAANDFFAPEAPSAEAMPPAADVPADPASGDGLQWQSFDFASSFAEEPAPSASQPPPPPPSVPSGDSAASDTPLPTFASFSSLTDAEADVPATPAPPTPTPSPPTPSAPVPAEPEPPVRPEGADVLTVVSGIDDDIEQQLYAIDVTKLDQIARWSRSEARRVAQELGLKPQVVMDRWVFEAQSVLFDQYQQQLPV